MRRIFALTIVFASLLTFTAPAAAEDQDPNNVQFEGYPRWAAVVFDDPQNQGE